MNKNTYIMLEEEEYKGLLEDALTYRALRNSGVDNWEWYDISIGNFVDAMKNQYPNYIIEKYKRVHNFDEDDELEIEDYVNLEIERALKIHWDLSKAED